MAILFREKPALISLALVAFLNDSPDEKARATNCGENTLDIILPKASSEGILIPLPVRNVHIARLMNCGTRRMPAAFLLRNWGSCDDETRQQYEKPLIDDARLLGGKLSHGMSLLLNGTATIDPDVFFPLDEPAWTIIDKEVQELSAACLQEADASIAIWQSTPDLVAKFLRENIDKAELHLMHMMGGPTVDTVMQGAQSYYTGRQCCVRLDRLLRKCSEISVSLDEREVHTIQPATVARVGCAIVEAKRESGFPGGGSREAQFLSQVNIHPETKDIEALMDIVSAGQGESLGQMLGVRGGPVDENDLVKLEEHEFSDELFFSGIETQPNTEQALQTLIDDLKKIGLGELADENLMAAEEGEESSSGAEEDEENSADDELVMSELLDREMQSFATHPRDRHSCVEHLMSSMSLEDCAQPGPATVLLSELRRKET